MSARRQLSRIIKLPTAKTTDKPSTLKDVYAAFRTFLGLEDVHILRTCPLETQVTTRLAEIRKWEVPHFHQAIIVAMRVKCCVGAELQSAIRHFQSPQS